MLVVASLLAVLAPTAKAQQMGTLTLELTDSAAAAYRSKQTLPPALIEAGWPDGSLRPIFREPNDSSHRDSYFGLGMNRWFAASLPGLDAATKGLDTRVGGGVLRTEFHEPASAGAVQTGPVGLRYSLPDDYSVHDMWGLDRIQAPQAWDLARGDSTVIIAILENGFDLSHPDLVDNIYVNPGEDVNHNGIWDAADNNGVDDDHNGYVDDISGWDFVYRTYSGYTPAPGQDLSIPDNNVAPDTWGHGTHGAGCAAGRTDNGIGIAAASWNVRLMPIRDGYPMVDANGWWGMWGISFWELAASGIQYAVDNGARVISYASGATSAPTSLQVAIQYARANNAIFLASAMNANTQTPYYPAAWPEALAVAATDRADRKVWFSNYGTWVDICAPGIDIWSTISNNQYHPIDYYMWAGTSFSAPIAASVAALVISANPQLTDDQVEAILRTTCDIVDSANPGYQGLLGSGRINARRAVEAAYAQPVGTLAGSVRSTSQSSRPIADATVSLLGTGIQFNTDSSGTFWGVVPAGSYDLTAWRDGFTPASSYNVVVAAGDTTNIQFELNDNAGPTIAGTTQILNTSDTGGPYEIEARVADPSGVSGVRLYYTSSFSGGPHSVPMTLVDSGSGLMGGAIPGQAFGSRVQYWIAADDSAGHVSEDPEGAPWPVYAFHVAAASEIVADDMEFSVGWTINQYGSDNATSGIWTLVDPNGVYTRGGALVVSPEDHTETGVLCWVTGQDEPDPAYHGTNDVDGGITTLYSPIYDLQALPGAVLSYWRWYSNDTGGWPGVNYWVAQVTADGTNWVDLERTRESRREWTQRAYVLGDHIPLTDHVQVRFVADGATPSGVESVVEGCVDDLRIDGVTTVADAVPPAVAVLFPNGGEVLDYFEPVSFSWHAADDVGVVHARAEVSLDGGTNWSVVLEGPYNDEAAIVWSDLLPSSAGTEIVQWRVTVVDGVRHEATDICDGEFFVSGSPTPVPAVEAGGLLRQNTPNPFNPRTKLSFELAEPSAVRLGVYDLRGSLVRTLVNSPLEKGSHEVAWDGADSQGRSVPSGAYIARLVAGDRASSIRMVLVR